MATPNPLGLIVGIANAVEQLQQTIIPVFPGGYDFEGNNIYNIADVGCSTVTASGSISGDSINVVEANVSGTTTTDLLVIDNIVSNIPSDRVLVINSLEDPSYVHWRPAPVGTFIGNTDTQTVSNKTLLSTAYIEFTSVTGPKLSLYGGSGSNNYSISTPGGMFRLNAESSLSDFDFTTNAGGPVTLRYKIRGNGTGSIVPALVNDDTATLIKCWNSGTGAETYRQLNTMGYQIINWTITTVNATPTTAFTLPIPVGRIYHLNFLSTGFASAGVPLNGSFTRSQLNRANNKSGVLALSVAMLVANTSDVGMAVAYVVGVSGNNVTISITGLAAATIVWNGTVEVKMIT